MRKNTLKEKLKRGEICSGAFLGFDCAATASMMAWAGFDWVLLDAEHGHFSQDSLRSLLDSLKDSPATVLVRVGDDSVFQIKQALELGAEGVLVPMIMDREQTEKVLEVMLYSPKGNRSTGYSRSNGFGLDMDYWHRANDELLTMMMIENVHSIEKIDDILSVPGVDVAFVGPYDLAASMGLVGQASHPQVMDAIDTVIEACHRHGVAPGMFCGGGLDQARRMARKGMQMLCFTTDYYIMADESRRLGAIRF